MQIALVDAAHWENHIEVNQNILVGKPGIRGARISLELLLDRLADGWSMEDILSSNPHLTRENMPASISFAAQALCPDEMTGKLVRFSAIFHHSSRHRNCPLKDICQPELLAGTNKLHVLREELFNPDAN